MSGLKSRNRRNGSRDDHSHQHALLHVVEQETMLLFKSSDHVLGGPLNVDSERILRLPKPRNRILSVHLLDDHRRLMHARPVNDTV
jgi:hypothetical protein